MSAKVIPFGKYRGEPVERLLSDPDYFGWLSSQPWFTEKFQWIIDEMYGDDAKLNQTPIHNKIQAMFLEPGFRFKFLSAFVGKDIRKLEIQTTIDCMESSYKSFLEKLIKIPDCRFFEQTNMAFELGDSYYSEGMISDTTGLVNGAKRELERLIEHEKGLSRLTSCEDADVLPMAFAFEELSIDVFISASPYGNFAIEIKPVLSDDYPKVIRQVSRAMAMHSNIKFAHNCKPTTADQIAYTIQRNKTNYVVLIGEYIGVGASFDQVVSMFARSDIGLVKLSQIE